MRREHRAELRRALERLAKRPSYRDALTFQLRRGDALRDVAWQSFQAAAVAGDSAAWALEHLYRYMSHSEIQEVLIAELNALRTGMEKSDG